MVLAVEKDGTAAVGTGTVGEGDRLLGLTGSPGNQRIVARL